MATHTPLRHAVERQKKPAASKARHGPCHMKPKEKCLEPAAYMPTSAGHVVTTTPSSCMSRASLVREITVGGFPVLQRNVVRSASKLASLDGLGDIAEDLDQHSSAGRSSVGQQGRRVSFPSVASSPLPGEVGDSTEVVGSRKVVRMSQNTAEPDEAESSRSTARLSGKRRRRPSQEGGDSTALNRMSAFEREVSDETVFTTFAYTMTEGPMSRQCSPDAEASNDGAAPVRRHSDVSDVDLPAVEERAVVSLSDQSSQEYDLPLLEPLEPADHDGSSTPPYPQDYLEVGDGPLAPVSKTCLFSLDEQTRLLELREQLGRCTKALGALAEWVEVDDGRNCGLPRIRERQRSRLRGCTYALEDARHELCNQQRIERMKQYMSFVDAALAGKLDGAPPPAGAEEAGEDHATADISESLKPEETPSNLLVPAGAVQSGDGDVLEEMDDIGDLPLSKEESAIAAAAAVAAAMTNTRRPPLPPSSRASTPSQSTASFVFPSPSPEFWAGRMMSPDVMSVPGSGLRASPSPELTAQYLRVASPDAASFRRADSAGQRSSNSSNSALEPLGTLRPMQMAPSRTPRFRPLGAL